MSPTQPQHIHTSYYGLNVLAALWLPLSELPLSFWLIYVDVKMSNRLGVFVSKEGFQLLCPFMAAT